MRCYRRLLNISYKDHITNEEARRKIQTAIGEYDKLLTLVKKRKLRWFGHVTRSSGLATTILQGTVKGIRRRGRQKKRWKDNMGLISLTWLLYPNGPHSDTKLVQFQRFSQFHILLLLVTEANLSGLYIFTFETPQGKNHFATNFIKIHSGVTEILSVSCFVLFLVTADGGHLRMPKCKKLKSFHARTILTQNWSSSIVIF